MAELPQEKKWAPPLVVFLQEACDYEWRWPTLCTRMMHIGRALSPHLDFDSGRESVCRPQEIIEAFEVFDEAGFQPNVRVHEFVSWSELLTSATSALPHGADTACGAMTEWARQEIECDSYTSDPGAVTFYHGTIARLCQGCCSQVVARHSRPKQPFVHVCGMTEPFTLRHWLA